MTLLDELDIHDIERTLSTFCNALKLHRDAINALNVYPVPDGDTGTNMSLTLESVVQELAGAGDDAASKWKAIRYGSLMGARGNSGVILSQILRALADDLAPVPSINAEVLAGALESASAAAYGAVMKPVEGTILTVVRESAAEASVAAAEGETLLGLLERSAAAGKVSLDNTPELLDVLKDAGVVDAGGAGFLLLLDSFLHVVDGRDLPPPPVVDRAVAPQAPAHGDHAHHHDVSDLRYEVMFFLEADDERIEHFKADWAAIGDSIVVVGGDGLWNCHVHSNDIGASIEAGINAGRPTQIRVTDLFEEMSHPEEISFPEDADTTVTITNPEPATTAVLAVAAGFGVQQIFESLGVHAVIRGGQSMNPSTRQFVQAVEQVGAQQVVILPNNKNIIPVAEQVDGQVDATVLVIATRGIAEGFASLLAFDPGADAHANQEAMTEAAKAVVAGEVTCAVREAETAAGPVRPGDWIGLDRGGVRSVGGSIAAAATALLDALVGADHELVTVIAGDQADPATNEAIAAWLGEHRPDVEAVFHDGGQPLYPYYFGVE
ncbi:MAG: DAK2 domain-containing protein [Acidimicrobiales bacterium]